MHVDGGGSFSSISLLGMGEVNRMAVPGTKLLCTSARIRP